jgi:hypothetical protein
MNSIGTGEYELLTPDNTEESPFQKTAASQDHTTDTSQVASTPFPPPVKLAAVQDQFKKIARIAPPVVKRENGSVVDPPTLRGTLECGLTTFEEKVL